MTVQQIISPSNIQMDFTLHPVSLSIQSQKVPKLILQLILVWKSFQKYEFHFLIELNNYQIHDLLNFW